ncbi:FIT family protein CG10671 [Trichogramma pretiosum]|uniref:FIT family protein CG10671 n=1 Tax=Trichogramma pretiosum TaxID=7493 RepID=UPI0006C94D03|nr:FIT family protein CG10671 [Trichogramma pretiosum]
MSKRKPINANFNDANFQTNGSLNYKNTNLNFRPKPMPENRGGTRPIAEPSSVSLILVTMIVHVCKKSLLYDPKLKAGIYLILVLIGSILADVLPIPKTYFSKSNNIFNRLFIKWAWGWLLTTVGPWIIITAYTIGCGRRSYVIRHIARLVFATLAWIFWIQFFHFVETNYGRCVSKDKSLTTKVKCLQAGNMWSSLDISGHAFIIIYSTLILAEEGYSFLGWEKIKDSLMHEEYNRKNSNETNTNYLKNLPESDFSFLNKAYKDLTPYLRGLFIAMTIQQLIWDVNLVATILYYHTMIEKFLGAVAAILTWYMSYNWLFRIQLLGFSVPGEGSFKYYESKDKITDYVLKSRRSFTYNRGPLFMGMPIKTGKEELNKVDSRTKDLDKSKRF